MTTKNIKLKSEKLNEIHKQNNQAFTIDVCLLILKLHANHGNGLEDDATDILKKMVNHLLTKLTCSLNQIFQLVLLQIWPILWLRLKMKNLGNY